MDITKKIEKFAPVDIEVDRSLATEKEWELIEELVKASHYIDEIFLRQVYDKNVELRERLRKDSTSPEFIFFTINQGPFDRIDDNRPFIKGVPPKPEGANFYPTDLKKEEFEDWLKTHPSDRGQFESNFTNIERDGDKLIAVPYSKTYEEWLTPAAGHLRKAAVLANNVSLKKYLIGRADAFVSNDYFQSDADWVRLSDHTIEVVVGPYEVYEDALFGYKAAFESFVTYVDKAESKRLAKVVGFIPELEQHLPVEDNFKGIGRSPESPITVSNLIYSAGDSKAGIQTLAFNLPNDERVRREYGSKKVMMKNVHHAKFEKILKPIASLVLNPRDFERVEFEAFFSHTLLHEISHGIGPGEIQICGKDTTVGRELKELYATIEECKADTLAVYNNMYLVEKGLYSKSFAETLGATYLAGIFRSIRFGVSRAHGGGNAIQFNYLLEKGGIIFDKKTNCFGINEGAFLSAIKDLAHDILMIEACGDYKAASKFMEKYSNVKPETQKVIDRLKGVPVDIRPKYAFE